MHVLYFANPATPSIRAAMAAGEIGCIDTPLQGNVRPAGVTWCADNGAFSDKFDEKKWWKFLTDSAPDAPRCKFAVAPDVVGDAWRTLLRSRPWFKPIRELGYPVAFVAQNGFHLHGPIPWDDFDALFIGGDDVFKLGPHAVDAVHQAKTRGKWVHMGRVNSERRWKFARAIGCDSADGTILAFGPDINMLRVQAWNRLNDHPPFDFAEGAP